MWRRYGDAVYAVLVLAVFSVEALALAGLTWAFLASDDGFAPGGVGLGRVLIAVVALTALALMVVTSYTLVYQANSTRYAQRRIDAARAWRERWMQWLFTGANRPEEPYPDAAVDGLIEVRASTRGIEADRVLEVLRSSGSATVLVDRAVGAGQARWKPRTSRSVARRLEALDSLANARLPETIEPLLALVNDPEPAVRAMALRAAGRSMGAMPAGTQRDDLARRMGTVLNTQTVPAGVIEEALLLMEGAAVPAIRALIEAQTPVRILSAALDAIGRLKLLSLADAAAASISHSDSSVRAAALRGLGLLGHVPRQAHSAVIAACSDSEEIVRIQAARALYLLDPAAALPVLWKLLDDESWWVRRAAAWSHVRLGASGVEGLRRAAGEHPDLYARHMAVQVLLDARLVGGDEARLLRQVS